MQKSESMLEESNLSNQYPTKLKPFKLRFSNLFKHPYDTNKSCELHKRGHSTDECITLKK